MTWTAADIRKTNLINQWSLEDQKNRAEAVNDCRAPLVPTGYPHNPRSTAWILTEDLKWCVLSFEQDLEDERAEDDAPESGSAPSCNYGDTFGRFGSF